MTWYRKRIAMDEDTGQQFPVIVSTSDFDNALYPTIFFNYFTDAPKLILGELNGLLQKEEG